MSDTPRTLLAFDYGERRIGVATGQTLTGTAAPLGTLAATGGKPDWDEVARMVADWAPDALVVGLPLNMDGTEQPITHDARRFSRRLAARFRLPVHLCDERLSSREAAERLRARGRGGEADDAVAAQVILEGWMEGEHAG